MHESSKAAVNYWDRVLDPQNLEHSNLSIKLKDELLFAQTFDFDESVKWLKENSASGWLIDLGAGLGINTFAFSLLDEKVIAVDGSLTRLRQLKCRAELVKLKSKPLQVVALAEALPFRDGSIQSVYTKSVLIHTDVKVATEEIVRILRPGGHAAITEPTAYNPMVNIYRKFFAPSAWKLITRYFNDSTMLQIKQTPGIECKEIKRFYIVSFLAFIFEFKWPRPKLFHRMLRILSWFDHFISFFWKQFQHAAWFVLIKLEKK